MSFIITLFFHETFHMKNKWKMNDEVQTKPNLYATGIKFLKLVKTPLNVALRKTDVIKWLFLRVILTSKKEKKSFSSHSEVNLMFGCLVFM